METEPYEDEGPSVLGSYAHAWGTLKAMPGRLILMLFLFAVLQLPAYADFGGAFGSLVGNLYRLLVLGPLTFGLSYCFLIAIRGNTPEVGDLFAPFQRAYTSAVAASFLLPVVLVIASLPMIGALGIVFLGDEPSPILTVAASTLVALPIFAAVRLSFVPYLLIEEGLGPIDVLGESWARTQPVQMPILGVEMLSAALLAIGLALLVVGAVPAMILAGLAIATIYDDVSPDLPDEDDGVDLTPPSAV
ncbi:MAG: hypothetical protein P8R42_16390 [Candidatus Binatia bacterium]|nr:hypothetical protein [Candidatus Binatia bacterium]